MKKLTHQDSSTFGTPRNVPNHAMPRDFPSPASGMESGTRFQQSFTAVVNTMRGPCQTKRHFRGCVREVIGYLDSLAARDPERFTWVSAAGIVEHCNRFSQGKAPYKLRMVMYALAYLRKHCLIERVKRFRCRARRDGFIVAAHGCFTEQQGTECVWVGYSSERAVAVQAAAQAVVHSIVHDGVHTPTSNCAQHCAHSNGKKCPATNFGFCHLQGTGNH